MRIVFIGAGGIGLSSLIHLMLDCGISKKDIIGIDADIQQQSLNGITGRGVALHIHGKFECDKDDIIFYSDAVIRSQEFLRYKEHKPGAELMIKHSRTQILADISMFSYFDFVGELSKYFKTITISGSHGKSTTTSMTISAMNKLIPQFGLGIVGTLMSEFGGKNYLINQNHKDYIHQIIHHILHGTTAQKSSDIKTHKPYFVIEGDEFNRHFHYLNTDIALITNIEHDHVDVYPSKQDYLDAFQYFVDNTHSQIIIHPQDNHKLQFPTNTLETLGIHFDFKYVFGDHNQANANLVYSLLQYITQEHRSTVTQEHADIQKAIEQFPGIRRRQEILYQGTDGCIISDYAHHPSEVQAAYAAIRKHFPDKKIIGIFQPHQAARVLEFEQDFIQSLSGFDELHIYQIYAARENYEQLAALHQGLSQAGSFESYSKVFADICHGVYLEDINQARNIVQDYKDSAVVVICTAGNLDMEIRRRLSQKE